jgi:hypothetical protein
MCHYEHDLYAYFYEKNLEVKHLCLYYGILDNIWHD